MNFKKHITPDRSRALRKASLDNTDARREAKTKFLSKLAPAAKNPAYINKPSPLVSSVVSPDRHADTIDPVSNHAF